MITRSQFYIGGAWVDPLDGTPHEVIDPSTEEACGIISLGGQADTNAAVEAATAASAGWMSTPAAHRIAALERLLEAYNARSEDLALVISQEMGAPIDLSRNAHVPAGAFHIETFLGAARQIQWAAPFSDTAPGTRIMHEPVGVCALITPWNWPMNQLMLKVGAALVAGNTMVLKPSEESPLSAAIFAEIVDAIDLPPGVFNLINGDGAGVGTQLCTHPGVDMVSFTGSSRAGRLICKAAADTLKRVHLELGGKGANLIFADADDTAVRRGVQDLMRNTGQSCTAPSRMLVEASVYDEAVKTAVDEASKIAVAPAARSGDHLGPVVSERQWTNIQSLIQTGISEGARLVAGGPGRPEGLHKGYFVRPTVFADVTNDMTIAREEIFGPVLAILKFDTEEEAVSIANDTPYGLMNYVQSKDGARRNRLAKRLRAGSVAMNGEYAAAGAPFGGIKMSGYGLEGGVHGILDFTVTKVISGWAVDEST